MSHERDRTGQISGHDGTERDAFGTSQAGQNGTYPFRGCPAPSRLSRVPTPTDLPRLRTALTEILSAVDLAEAHAIATKALEPPPRQYAVAETLADLDPHTWRVVGRRTFRRMQWCIPVDEIKAFTERRDAGQFTSAQARQGDHFVVLARRMPSVPDARPMLRKVISKERNSL